MKSVSLFTAAILSVQFAIPANAQRNDQRSDQRSTAGRQVTAEGLVVPSLKLPALRIKPQAGSRNFSPVELDPSKVRPINGILSLDQTLSLLEENNVANSPKEGRTSPFNPQQRPNRGGGITGQPGTGTTQPNNTDMQGVDPSNVPGVSCALVDNRPYTDLLSAINNLTQTVQPRGQCAEDSDMKSMKALAEQMLEAGKQIKAIVAAQNGGAPATSTIQGVPQTPAVTGGSPELNQLGQLSSSLELIVNGMNTIGQTVTNSTMMRPECRRHLGVAGFAFALSDLATSLAPIAMIAAAANPQLKVAMQVILGVAGVGTVAKVIDSLSAKGVLDMKKPENRMALLQNTCEFAKIANRVRFLILAQNGRYSQALQEVRDLVSRNNTYLQGQRSTRLTEVVKNRDAILAALDSANEMIPEGERRLLLSQNLIEGKGAQDTCLVAQQMLNNYSYPNEFPKVIIDSYRRLLANQEGTSSSQQMPLTLEDSQRKRLIQFSARGDTASCAREYRNYLKTVADILNYTRQTINAQRISLGDQLGRDTEYSDYREKEKRAQVEVSTVLRVHQLMLAINKDNSVIDRTELTTQMVALKDALFNRGKFSGSSPVKSWLQFHMDQYNLTLNRFDKEWKQLVEAAYEMTPSGRAGVNSFTLAMMNTGTMGGTPAPVVSPITLKIYEDYRRDTLAAEQLQTITKSNVAADQKDIACRGLENSWKEIMNSINYVDAQTFFCSYISPLFDASVEGGIKRHCETKATLDGRTIKQKSVIQETIDAFHVKKLNDKAKLLDKKMVEIGCEVPDLLTANR